MDEKMELLKLPDELLVEIFKFCDIASLGRLSCTNKRIHSLILSETGIWSEKSKFVLGTNMLHPAMRKRCKPLLIPKKRCQLSKSWHTCTGDKRVACTYPKCMPWLQLESDNVYCSTRSRLIRLKRNDDGKIVCNKKRNYIFNHDDISKFSVGEDKVVIAFTDGALCLYRKYDMSYLDTVDAHLEIIFALCIENDIIITGSRDQCIKIWKMGEFDILHRFTKNMHTRVLSTAIMPSSRYFVAGFSGTNNIHPLQLFDLERGQHITNCGETYYYGAGILDIYPEDHTTFLTCGYDTTVKLWDIRCPKSCCMQWMDPYDNVIYCVTSDHNVTVVSGANRHGTVHIWDKRHNTLSQFTRQIWYNDSPVYSVAFDASHIFASLSKDLLEFTFTCSHE